jgi:hypothetical protein
MEKQTLHKFIARHSAVALEPDLLTEPLKTTLYLSCHLLLQYIINEQ